MCERLLLWFYLYSLLSQLPEIQSFRVTIKRGVMLPDRNEAPDIMALYNRRCREIFFAEYLVVRNICLPLQCQKRHESLAQLV